MDDVCNWLFRENLKGFLVALADLIDYRFDEWDWDAVDAGLTAPDDGSGWFDYPLIGRVATLQVAVSLDDDQGHVSLKVTSDSGDACLEKQVRAVWMVFNRFSVSPDVRLSD